MNAKKAKLLRKVAATLSPTKETEYVGNWVTLLSPGCTRAIYQRLKKNANKQN